jgi:hypothetical protein
MNESTGWTEAEKDDWKHSRNEILALRAFSLFIAASHAIIENRFLIPRLAKAERFSCGKFQC